MQKAKTNLFESARGTGLDYAVWALEPMEQSRLENYMRLVSQADQECGDFLERWLSREGSYARGLIGSMEGYLFRLHVSRRWAVMAMIAHDDGFPQGANFYSSRCAEETGILNARINERIARQKRKHDGRKLGSVLSGKSRHETALGNAHRVIDEANRLHKSGRPKRGIAAIVSRNLGTKLSTTRNYLKDWKPNK